MRSSRTVMAAGLALAAALLGGCSKPQYDTSTPQAALDSMYQMIADKRSDMLGEMIYIQPRDITFSDGVTEASAIGNVIDKTGDMLGRLYRVAEKLHQRFPDEINREVSQAKIASRRNGFEEFGRFLADPFGLMDQQRQRLSVEDLGDGTAAVLVDGKPAFGVGMQMRDVDGHWKIEIPIDLMQKYRPNTREEWSVVANMMLSLEKSLTAFESELDRGDFRDLQQASARAGRLLGERGFVQAIIYQAMKDKSGQNKM